jgi:nitrogen-specific signal transduction histidine kinase
MRRSEPPVRYDDSVVTLLSIAALAEGPAADAHFSNLLDLVVQDKPSTRGDIRLQIMDTLRGMSQQASVKTRQRAASHIARMPVDVQPDVATLLVQITHESPRHWLADVRMTSHAWSSILPRLPMHEVRCVAARNDLPVAISLQLVAIKPTLLLLPAPAYVDVPEILLDTDEDIIDLVSAPTTPANDFEPLPQIILASQDDDDTSQVKSLLDRIAWFRKRPASEPEMEADPLLLETEQLDVDVPVSAADSLFLLENPLAYVAAPPPLEDLPLEPPIVPSPQVDLTGLLADWYWETDRSGMFVFAGQNAAERALPAGTLPSLKGQHLLDWLEGSPHAQKAEVALQRRTGFHHIALHVEDGGFAGDWLLSAVAAFDPQSGLYLGHRGVAKRQLQQISATGMNVPDALATAAHETRTPLNAIMGFAQMIEAQPFGPVSPAYAAQADAILDASSRLLRALDDVSETSRLDRGLASMRDSGFSLNAVLEDVFAQLRPSAARRQVRFSLRIAAGVPSMWSDKDILERCVGRLAVAMMSVAAAGESITVAVRDAQADYVAIAFSRPARLRDIADADLMKPVQSNEQDQPRLHIGFALRLVERLAAVIGGRLSLTINSIELLLPAVPSLAQAHESSAKDAAARQ